MLQTVQTVVVEAVVAGQGDGARAKVIRDSETDNTNSKTRALRCSAIMGRVVDETHLCPTPTFPRRLHRLRRLLIYLGQTT
jgi:hypothetical protein